MDSERAYRVSWTLCLLVVIGAFCQFSLGAQYSPTGEQLSSGIPLATLILFVCGAALLFLNYRKADAPGISIFHCLLLISLSFSLLGLAVTHAGHAVKELIQIYEVFVVAYFVFLVNRRLLLDVLRMCSPVLVTLLLLLHVFRRNDWFPLYLSDAKLETFVIFFTPFVIMNSGNVPAFRRFLALSTLSLLCGVSFTNGGLLLCFLIVLMVSGLFLLESRRTIVAYTVVALACSLLPIYPVSAWQSLNPDYDATHRKRLFIEYAAALAAPRYFPLGIGPGLYKKGINYLKEVQPSVPHKDDLKIPKDSNSQYQIYFVESGILTVLMLLAVLMYLAMLSMRIEDKNERRLRLILLLSLCLTAFFCVIFSRGIGIIAGAFLGIIAAKRFSENERVLYPFCAVVASLTFFSLMAVRDKGYDQRHYQSAYNSWVVKNLFQASGSVPREALRIVPLKNSKEKSQVITIEAENSSDIWPNFKVVPANDSSGDRVIESANNSGKGIGKAGFTVDIPETGYYTLFARVWWEDGCSNSLEMKIRNQSRTVLSDEIFRKWHIIESLKPVKLRKGKTKIDLIPAEDGIKVDYFGLSLADPM